MFVFDKLTACELPPLVDVPGEVVIVPIEPFAAPGGSCWVGEFWTVLALCIGDNCFPWGGPVTKVSSGGAAGAEGPDAPYKDVGTFDVEAPAVACRMCGGEFDCRDVVAAAATAVNSCCKTEELCDVDGRIEVFLLCLSRPVVSLWSLGSLCFLVSLRTSFASDLFDSLVSLASLSRWSLASRSWTKKIKTVLYLHLCE